MIALSWNSVDLMADELAELVRSQHCQIDLIVAVARGGFVPARLLSSRLKVMRMAAIGVAYRDEARTQYEIYSFPTPVRADHRILLVEDAVESGQSLAGARERLAAVGAGVWTAAFYYQARSRVQPDFSLGPRDQIPIFPWE